MAQDLGHEEGVAFGFFVDPLREADWDVLVVEGVDEGFDLHRTQSPQ
jgi:hypothetical protein